MRLQAQNSLFEVNMHMPREQSVLRVQISEL